jgi:glutamate carboxypeptidase
LRELAHFLFFVEDLNDKGAKTSVNLTVASGGSVPNVIAEIADAQVDMRFATLAEAKRLQHALNTYQRKDPRVEVEITIGLNRPPMERTEANAALLEEAQVVQRKLGLNLGTAVVGGGSDGNFTSALGIATLDGLGSLGVGEHARHEHIELRATLERVALLAALLSETR